MPDAESTGPGTLVWFRRDLRDYDHAAFHAGLEARGRGLRVLYGRARDEIPRLARSLGLVAVYVHRDYEPLAIAHDSGRRSASASPMWALSASGIMHNRLRMLTASFLVKDPQVDWRRGERYFSNRLFDYDLAANNGGWQWCASTGCDAQPWFRIFNPATQSRRFDPEGANKRRWTPELARDTER